jgi:hypothetical protein
MKSYWQCDLIGGVTMPVAKRRLSLFDAPSIRRTAFRRLKSHELA